MIFQVLNPTASKNCESRCQEQGIEYFRFNPQLEETVESNEINNRKLLAMLHRTRVYMNDVKDQVDKLASLLQQSDLVIPIE